MLKKIVVFIVLASTVLRAYAQKDALFIDSAGRIGIGTEKPRALLDAGSYIDGGLLGTVMGRLAEGDTFRSGTYLGVRGFSTQPQNEKSFSIEHSFYGNVNSAISFFRGPGNFGGSIAFSTGNNTERMRIDGQGTLSLGSLRVDQQGNMELNSIKATGAHVQVNSPLMMNRNTLYLASGTDLSYGMRISVTKGHPQTDIFGWDGVTLGCVSYDNKYSRMVNVVPGGVGIGTDNVRALLDVGYADSTRMSAVLGRLPGCDDKGTYLGVRCYSTDGTYTKSFALEHTFCGATNSAINFYRGPIHSGGFITFSTNENNERMRIGPDGRVGIGVIFAEAGLDVNVSPDKHDNWYAYINKNYMVPGDRGRQSPRQISILGHGDVATYSEFILYSDARIKNKIGLSDSKKDLVLLNRLKVTDYTYIDKVAYGNAVKKGFIAQEVEEVFPQAVNKGNEYVPDIYTMPEKVQRSGKTCSFTMKKEHHLANGDVVKVLTARGAEYDTVNVTGKYTFTIPCTEDSYDDAFVYGKRVTDFRMVDYDRLFTLNVSATQELSKEVDSLKTENEALKKELELMKAANETIRAENSVIKADVSSLQSKIIEIEAKLNGTDNTATTSR